MLSGKKIMEEVENGNIVIQPFNEKQVNPNSYNLTLGDELVVYTEKELDCKKKNKTKTIKIPKDGYVLSPGELYLAKTREYTENPVYIPMISGRSSIGRVGLTVHISSGMGAIGFSGAWTLGITCVVPVKIYSGMEIGQIFYTPIIGNSKMKYKGKYANNGNIMASKIHEEL